MSHILSSHDLTTLVGLTSPHRYTAQSFYDIFRVENFSRLRCEDIRAVMRYFSVRPQFNGLRPPRMTGRKSELVDRLKQMVVDIKRSTGKSSIFPCPPGPQTARRCAPIMRPSPATTIPNHRSQPVKHVVPRSASSHSHGHNQNKGAGGLPSEHDRQALTLTQTPEYTARRNPFHKVKSLLRTRMLGYGETKILSFYISSQMMARTKRALAPGQEYAAGDTIITIRGFQEVQKRYEEFNSFYRIQVNNDYVTIPPPKKKTKKAAKGFDIPKEINISAQVRPNQINTIKISYSPYHYHYTVFKGAITVELVEYQTADSLSKLVPVNKTISSKPAVTTTAATTTIPLPPVVSASAPAPVPATTTPSVTNSVTGKVYNPAWLALKRQYINNINNDNKYSNYIDHATIYEPRVMEMTPEQAEELKLRVQQSDQSKFCAVCSIRRDDLMRCSRCKLRWYCGVEHQRLHWGVHKGECRPPTLEEEKNRKEEEDKDGSAKEMLAKYSKWMKELMANTRDTPMYMSDIRTATTDNSNGNNTQPNASSSSALTTPPTSSEKPRTKLLPPSNAADDDDDDDIIVGDTLVSLVCPLSIDRVQKPAKGKNCAHMRCFELSMFLMYSEQAYNWQCPICEKALPFNELMIDDRMAAVLTEVDDEITDLRVSPDGSWIPINNHLRAGYTSSKRDRDDDDDEDGAASPSLKKTKLNNPPEVFCLLDDDEDAPSSSSSSSSSPSSSSSSSSYPSSSSSPYGTPALPNPLTSGLNGSYTVYESAAYRQTSSHAQPSSSASGTGQSFDDAICID